MTFEQKFEGGGEGSHVGVRGKRTAGRRWRCFWYVLEGQEGGQWGWKVRGQEKKNVQTGREE